MSEENSYKRTLKLSIPTCRGSLLPLLDNHQFVYTSVEGVGEIAFEVLPREAHVDHEDGVPHDVPPPVVVGQTVTLDLIVAIVERVLARIAEDVTINSQSTCHSSSPEDSEQFGGKVGAGWPGRGLARGDG